MKTILKYKYEIICFLLILLILLLSKNIQDLSKNNESFLVLDGIAQYYPFFSEFNQKILNNSSLLFSSTFGLGINFLLLIFYYLLSPLNLILFSKSINNIEMFMLITTYIKIALAGSFFVYYLRIKYKKESILLLLFGLLYATSGYFAGFRSNLMWLDSIIIFPLLLIAIDQLIENKKKLNLHLIFFYSLIVIFNFYMGFIIGISAGIYFLIKTIIEKKATISIYTSYIFNMATSVLICAFILLPTILYLFNYYYMKDDLVLNSTNGFFIKENFNIITPLFYQPTFDLMAGNLNIFVGLPILIILLASFFRNIELKLFTKEDKISFIMIILIIISFFTPFVSNIFNGFYEPLGITYRYSFVLIFFLLSLTYSNLVKEQFKNNHWYLAIALFIIITYQTLELKAIYYGWGVLFFSFLIILPKHKIIPYLLLGLTIVYIQPVMQANHELNNSETYIRSEQKYLGLSNLQLKNYDIMTGPSINDSMGQSTNFYSSTINKKLANSLSKIGYVNLKTSMRYQNINPITDMLLGVQYQKTNFRLGNDSLYQEIEPKTYQFQYPLLNGFVINKNQLSQIKNFSNENIIENINDFVFQLTEKEEIYKPLLNGNDYKNDIKIIEAGYYIAKANKSQNQFFQISFSDFSTLINENYFLVYLEKDDKLTLSIQPATNTVINIKLYQLLENDLIKLYDSLQSFEIEKSIDLEAKKELKIILKEAQYYFLPVTYDPSWQIRVNGSKVKPINVNDIFLAIELAPGESIIQLDYQVKGFKSGLLISAITLCALVLYKKNLLAFIKINRYNEKK